MKKLDVLMLKSFIGPFILTTGVATFILLIQYLLKYFDDLVGKNLGVSVFGELLFYFSLNMMQNALPLGVLVASLMTFGNLGEHFELTAIKSAGISLLRILRPIFLFVCLVSVGVLFFNNIIIPAANLKAYSLLYDIKQTKPALDIKAGAFYNGIPDYSIKVREKYPDGKTLKDIIIYDHSEGRGNETVILADSSLMYTILNDKYLKLELFRGHYYSEQPKSGSDIDQFNRTEFEKMDLVFSLSSFDLKRRKEELFQNNRQMKNIAELTADIDSFETELLKQKANFIDNSTRYLDFHFENKMEIKQHLQWRDDSLRAVEVNTVDQASMIPVHLIFSELEQTLRKDARKEQNDTLRKKNNRRRNLEMDEGLVELEKKKILKEDSVIDYKKEYKNIDLEKVSVDTLSFADLEKYFSRQNVGKRQVYSDALSKARNVKVNLSSAKNRVYKLRRNTNLYTYEREKKYALSLACVLMFMIGAPLGAIIKKGGLGVPIIVAISFFILYYIVGSIGKQQTKELQLDPYTAIWMSDAVLVPFGLFFLRQARIDARLFEVDIYRIWIEKLKTRFAKKGDKG